MIVRMLCLLLALSCTTEPSATTGPAAPATPAAATETDRGELPSGSLYQLDVTLTDQHGQTLDLGAHRGHPVIVSMFYAFCPTACPMLIQDIRRFEDSLTEQERADLRIVLVSLDPARDTPEVLARVAKEHEVDSTRWTLARVEESEVRNIAAALSIRYRATSDGEMNHSSLLTLLDRNGTPVSHLEGLRRDATALREALRELPEN